MFIRPHPARLRGFRILPIVAMSSLLLAGSVLAQTPVAQNRGAPVAPDVSEAVQEAYDDLDWTGRPTSPATLRKEAGAALVEGRRNCARTTSGAERAACLETVQSDYQSMLARLKMRTASRR